MALRENLGASRNAIYYSVSDSNGISFTVTVTVLAGRKFMVI